MSADLTDRELLELAAKAAGIVWVDDGAKGYWRHPDGRTEAWWNPLTDDGDALRLAVKLGLQIGINHEEESVAAWAAVAFRREATGTDPCAALRLAIVRAAAEIERAKA